VGLGYVFPNDAIHRCNPGKPDSPCVENVCVMKRKNRSSGSTGTHHREKGQDSQKVSPTDGGTLTEPI